jgi:hypothetical protein
VVSASAKAPKASDSPHPDEPYALATAGTESAKVAIGEVSFAVLYNVTACSSRAFEYVALARDGDVGGDEDEVALYVVFGEYRKDAMANAAAAEAQTSVPGALELTGYAVLGDGMSWSPPLSVSICVGWSVRPYQYALSTSLLPTCTNKTSSEG